MMMNDDDEEEKWTRRRRFRLNRSGTCLRSSLIITFAPHADSALTYTPSRHRCNTFSWIEFNMSKKRGRAFGGASGTSSTGTSLSDLLATHARNKNKRRRRKKSGSNSNKDHHVKPIECIRRHINKIDKREVQPLVSTQADKRGPKQNVICLLFIVINELPYEDVWRKWIENDGTTSHHDSTAATTVKVFIHAKNPNQVKSQWVKEHLIEKSFCPGWGTVELTKAMAELARVALVNTAEDESNNRNVTFLYASESCVPICTLSHAADRLFLSNHKSWLKVKYKPRNGYNGSSQWVPIEESALIPKECVCKADQWVALQRRHANIVLNMHDYIEGLKTPVNVWPCFQKGCASDEMYFPTLLSCCGMLPNKNNYRTHLPEGSMESSTSNGDGGTHRKVYDEIDMHQRLTYVVWNYADFGNYDSKKPLCDRPETFDTFSKELINRGLKEGCIFVRKVKDRDLNAEAWLQLVV